MAGTRQYFRMLPVKRYERSFERPVEKLEEEIEPIEETTVHTDITANPGKKNGPARMETEETQPVDNLNAIPDCSKSGSVTPGLVQNTGLKKIRKKKLRKNGKLD